MNIADDILKAYHEGYEQGRFDAIVDIPHGVEKGYSVVAVVRCRGCKHNRNCFIKEMIIAETKQDNPYCSCGAKMEDNR